MGQIEQAHSVVFIGEPTIEEIQLRSAQFDKALDKVQLIKQSLGVADIPETNHSFFYDLNVHNFDQLGLPCTERLIRVQIVEDLSGRLATSLCLLEQQSQQIKNYLELRKCQVLLAQIESHPNREYTNPKVIKFARETVAKLQSEPLPLIKPKPEKQITLVEEKKVDINKLPNLKNYVKKRATRRVRILLEEFLTTTEAYEIVEIVRNFQSESSEQAKDFVQNLAGRLFSELGFIVYKSLPVNSGMVVFTPKQTQSFFKRLNQVKENADKEEVQNCEELNDYDLNHGLKGKHVPDAIGFKVVQGKTLVTSIGEFKCVNIINNHQYDKILAQSEHFHSPQLDKDLRLCGDMQLDPMIIGTILHEINPHIPIQPVSMAAENNLIYVVPFNTTLIIPGYKSKEAPINRNQLADLIDALIIDSQGENSQLLEHLPKRKLEHQTSELSTPPSTSANELISSTSKPVIREITIQAVRTKSPEEARRELRTTLPNSEALIREVWKAITKRLMGFHGDHITLSQARSLFPELDKPDSPYKLPIKDPLKLISLAEIVGGIVVQRYGQNLSRDANEELMSAALSTKRPRAA